MRAAVITKPGRLDIWDLPQPEVGPYGALCRILYGATCTATDLHVIDNEFPWPIKYPTVLGHESVGEVIEVGPKVRHLRVGDLVSRVGTPPPPDGSCNVTWGGFAQFGLAQDHRAMREDGLPPESWQAYRINQVVPPDINPADATMIITWRETLSYITRMGVKAGAGLAVVGSGGVGFAFLAHARHIGMNPIACIGSPSREQAARAAGATHFVDYRLPNHAAPLRDIRPQGFEFIIDAMGRSDTFDPVLPAAADGAVVAVYGLDKPRECRITPHNVPGTFTVSQRGYDEAEVHDRVIALMRSGDLKADWWFGREEPYPLEKIADAYAGLRERKRIKAVIQVG